MALAPEKKSRSLGLAGIAQISNDISRKFLDRSDLSRLLRIISSPFQDQAQVLSELDTFFVSNPQAKIKLVFVEDTVLVRNIFIMSSAMQELAQKFPEHLYVDFLSNVSPGFNLYSVSCEDDISGWKMCASCISKTNNPDTLRFLIVSVLQSIPKMKAQIKTITIHPAISDSLDMGTLLPNITIRHCILLIVQVLEQKISHLDAATQAQIKTILHILLHTRSLKVYNRHLNDFKAICPSEIFQYYFETWHPSRKLWCTKDNKRLKAEKTIYTYSTSLHYTLLTEMGNSPSLKDCLHVALIDDRELKNPPAVFTPPEPITVPVPVPEKPPSPVVCEQICEEKKTNGLEYMEFSSWEEFSSFLNSWCEEQKTIFVIRHSVQLNDEDMSQEQIQSLKYSTVNLGCSSYTRKRCPAIIQLRLGPEKDKLIITKADLNHIHDSEIDLPSRYTRKPESYVEVPTTLSNDACDKFMDRNDLTKLLRLPFPFGGESQILDELESIFNLDPAVKVKVINSEDKLMIKSLFIMTTAMQNLLQHFPEHLYVDFLPGLNQEFDLYSVLCQDESFSWKACAYCFARKDLSESLRFIIKSALQSNPNLSSQVKYCILNPEIRIPLDTEALLPNASTRYCLPLMLDSMNCKISFLSQMEQSQIRNLLVSLAQSSSVEVYTRYLVDLKAACPDEVFQFYFDTWHPCWKLWSEKDTRINDLEAAIFTYVKSKHQDLKAQVGSMSSLHQCLQTLLLFEDRELEELSENNHVDELERSASWELNNTAIVELKEEENCASTEEITTVVIQKDCEDMESDQLNGKEFHSWDEFCAYLETWSKEKFLVCQSSAVIENSSDENLDTPEMAVSLKYSWAQLFCNWKDCPAFIELAMVPQRDKLVITQSNLSHNHDVDEAMHPPPTKKCKLSTAVGLPAQVANNISRKFLEPSDIRRLLRFRSGAFEDRTQVLAELETLFVADPQAKVKLVFVEDKLLVKKIFIMTSKMKDVACKFPDNLFIDVFSNFGQSFDLYTIYCEERGVGWKVCAYCIAKKGVTGIISFLSSSLVQIIPTLNGQVKYLIVNPEIEETPNIEANLPHVTVRYCMHLVLDVLYRKITHLDTTVAAQIKNFLHILSHTCSLKVYDRYLNDLKTICPSEIFQYFYDTWHPRRKMWVKRDNKIEEAERTIFEIVSQNHLHLKTELGPVPSLHQCLCAVLGICHKTSAKKTLLHEADITPFFQNEESDVSPSSQEQAHDGDIPMLEEEEEVEVTLHKATFSTKPRAEVCEYAHLSEKQGDGNQQTSESLPDCDIALIEGVYISYDLNGMKFFSWYQFCEFFDHLCKNEKHIYKMRSATLFEKNNSNSEVFKFQHVQLDCYALLNTPADEISALSDLVPNACPATVTLQFSTDDSCLVVTEAQMEHNHRTDHQKFADLFKYFSLASYDKLSSLASSISRNFITPDDVDSLLGWKPVFEKPALDLLKLFRTLLSEDSKAQVMLEFSPATMQLESVFLMSSEMRCLLECFPSFLFLGEPLALNETYDLYTTMCEDNEKNSRECAYFIILKESPAPFTKLVASLIQSIPTLDTSVKDLLLQIDLKEFNLVRDLLPSCRVRISQTHALNALYQQVKESDPATQEKLKRLMYSLVNCCNPDLYNTYFTELETSSPDTFLQYFLQTWHSCKKDWCHGMKEGHFLECAARQKEMLLRASLDSPSSPATCIQALLKMTALGDDEEPMEVSDESKEQETVKSFNLKEMMFQSWDKFCDFFDQFCEEKKSLYKIAKVTPLVNMKEADLRCFKYQQVLLQCKATVDGSQQKHTLGKLSLPCPASITVQFSKENNCLVISQAQLLHNHTLHPFEFDACFRHCSLTSRPRFTTLSNNIASRFATSHHLKKLLNWSKLLEPDSLDLLKELEILLSEDPMAKLKLVFCQETFGLESVFIMTSKAKNLLINFPSLLFLGHSLMLNENFDLYTVLCEDNESNGRECAYFITRKESTTPVRYMVVSLIQSIPEIKESIEGMVLRVDLKELTLIQDLLPTCCVRMSQSHALDMLYNQIRGEDSATQEELKRLIYKLVHSQTSSQYSSYYNELESVASEHFFQYFLNTWHVRKEDWAECWSHKMKDGNFLEFTPWQAHELRAMLNFPSSLASCTKVLLEVVQSGEVPSSKNNGSPDFTNTESVALSLNTRSIDVSCLEPETSTLCTTVKEKSEKEDLNKTSEVSVGSPCLPAAVLTECFKTESVHPQNSTIPETKSLSLELTEILSQEALSLPVDSITDTTESKNELGPQPALDISPSQALNSLTNGGNCTEPQAAEIAIPSTSNSLNITDPPLNDEALNSLTNGGNCTEVQATEIAIPSTSNSQNIKDPPVNEEKPLSPNSLEGRVFLSWIEFRNFFNRWCERNMVLYKVKSCRQFCKTDTFAPSAAKMIMQLKFSYLHLVCKYSVVTHCYRTNSCGELPSPCQANIIIQAGPCNDRLVVTHTELSHNHHIMEEEFDRCFPRFMLKAKPFLFLKMTKSISKQFLMLKDLIVLVDRSCDEGSALKDLLQELVAIFYKDPNVKIKLVFCPDDAEIECIFIMTSAMRSLLERFPSLLYFDRSLMINEHFDLYTAHCEDADNRGRACAYFITRKESETPVRFMVVSMMQSISDTTKPKIKTAVVHAGFEELHLVQTLLPKSMVKMSQAYALESLNSRVELEEESVQEAIRTIICGLVLSSSPEIYQRNVRKLEAEAFSNYSQYFLQNWHCHKEMWVACWNLPEPQRSVFPKHVGTYRQSLMSTFNPPASLAFCVNGLLQLQSLKALTSTLDENMISHFYKKLCKPANFKLVQEEIDLTKQGHYEIKEHDEGFLLNDGNSDFLVNEGITHCSCSIFKTNGLPCRHIFATRLWIGEAVFDVKLLQMVKDNI